ncbi:MAG: hypothetical protein H6668_22820 [Ardenticatenaceae bacterium]|nr:hypothetical protein [Ardenticatenaceae bacterium]
MATPAPSSAPSPSFCCWFYLLAYQTRAGSSAYRCAGFFAKLPTAAIGQRLPDVAVDGQKGLAALRCSPRLSLAARWLLPSSSRCWPPLYRPSFSSFFNLPFAC